MSPNDLPGTTLHPWDMPEMDLSVELTKIRDLINSATHLRKSTRDELGKMIDDTRWIVNRLMSRYANGKKLTQWTRLLETEADNLQESDFNVASVHHLKSLLTQIQAEAKQFK